MPKTSNKTLKRLLTIILLWACELGFGQNLVPNPSFENYKKLQCNLTWDTTDFKRIIEDWFLPTFGSADILSDLVDSNCVTHCWSTNSLAEGRQNPRTGTNMAAIIMYSDNFVLDWKEYLEVKLTSPLVVGKEYYVEMFVSMADKCQLAHNNIGMNFSVQPDTAYQHKTFFRTLHRIPEIVDTNVINDYVNWVKISSLYVPDSAYEYLSIGNFFSNQETTVYDSSYATVVDNSYYFFDDIVVEESCGFLSGQSLYCQGDTVVLDAGSNGLSRWAIANNPSYIISTDRILYYPIKDTTTFLLYNRCDTQSIKVDVIPNHLVDLGAHKQLCTGDSILLDANYPQATNYMWNTGIAASKIYVKTPGIYWVEFEFKGCISRDTVEILPIAVDLGPDTIICDGAQIILNAFNYNATYVWQDGSTGSSQRVNRAGEFWVNVEVDGCTVADTIAVLLNNCEAEINMPNVFTPNGDGVNDIFKSKELENIQEVHITIFSRWGNLVHEARGETISWDGDFQGKPCAAGQYFWVLEFTDSAGQTKSQHGSVALFR